MSPIFIIVLTTSAPLTAMRDASSATVIVSLIRTSFLTSAVGFWKPCCNDVGAFSLPLRPLAPANLSFAGAFFFFFARREPCSSRASATSSASRA